MWWTKALCLAVLAGTGFAQSTQGIYNLLQRQMPSHADSFELSLVDSIGNANATGYDQYAVSSTSNGKILVEGTTLSALSSG
jgi:alpha-N-acetylglucosaminidase